MRIVIIGSGNVAEALAIAIANADNNTIKLTQIWGRNSCRVAEIAKISDCKNFKCEPKELATAELYILAVSDSAIAELGATLPFAEGAVVAHTAGSVPLKVLHKTSNLKRAVIYPMQTFSKGRKINFREVPIMIESDDPESLAIVKFVAKALCNNVIKTSSERRQALHLGAVFACNFVNAMLVASSEILSKNDLPLNIYHPLMQETIAKALQPDTNPIDVQSGPAVRGDQITIDRHLEMLKESPELMEIYKTISKYIWETSKKI